VSDTKTEPRIGYVVEVEPRMSGDVVVLIHQYEREGTPGWFHTKHEAIADAAKRMSRLAHELMRRADAMTKDGRGT
jgi:hypothetical protein